MTTTNINDNLVIIIIIIIIMWHTNRGVVKQTTIIKIIY